MIIHYSLNLEGEACPYPAIATLEALKELKSGEILEILCDCPQSINSIPHDATNRGFKVLEIDQNGPSLKFLIQKP
ncbi:MULTISPECIES: sulfurtransferase-like selenium metabolism protein YedF [unclassified Campylobacter]|uniref:sulfurtransferase-like selenium metabolism protein YedF n=1 Tax=unclassified Campylobacter TaxID=2593542 RepID=UPI000EA8539B|nr:MULTISPECIES: sulfurtransferase-like selenium metabolism protein YedF [unclassified Campylobacter]QOR01540.1 sulfurtransferase-like selenium metabolism protein YedF [Campylobacter sp. 2014D-0216]RKO65014.1 SirA-like protein [Campylobacter sp. P255]